MWLEVVHMTDERRANIEASIEDTIHAYETELAATHEDITRHLATMTARHLGRLLTAAAAAEVHDRFAFEYRALRAYIDQKVADPGSPLRAPLTAAIAEHGVTIVTLAVAFYTAWLDHRRPDATSSTDPMVNAIRDVKNEAWDDLLYGMTFGYIMGIDALLALGRPLSDLMRRS